MINLLFCIIAHITGIQDNDYLFYLVLRHKNFSLELITTELQSYLNTPQVLNMLSN